MAAKLLPFLLIVLITACDSGASKNVPISGGNPAPELTPENLSIPDNSAAIQFKILFMGNSHVAGMAEPISLLFEAGAPLQVIGKLSVNTGDFLTERLDDGQSIDVLKSDTWTHVIFQAQKYSQSGQTEYSTVGAQTWVQMAKSLNAMPILFPEHPQRGDSLEGQKVHDLHVSIAKLQSSCVAPVGLVWDRVIGLLPGLQLHRDDGNHASYTGNFLTALVFYQVISGNSADLIPFIDGIDIDASTQDLLGQITSEVIAQHPPCEY